MDHNKFSIEAMTKDATLAKEFLREVEAQSYRFIEEGWERNTDMEIIDTACFTFHVITREMMAADHQKYHNGIH